MADGQADETIVTKFIIEADDALAKINEFNAKIDAIKVKLKELVEASGKSVRSVATIMLKQFKSQQFEGLSQKDFGQIYGVDSEKYKQAIENVKEYQTALSQAMQEVNQEFRAAGIEAQKFQDIIATSTKSQGFVANVNTMKSAIAGFAKESGKSFQEVTNAMIQSFSSAVWSNAANNVKTLGANAVTEFTKAKQVVADYTKVATTGMKELVTETKKAEEAQKGLGSSLFSLGNIIKGVFVGLIYNVVMGILRGFTQTLSEATQYAYDLAKAVFQLELGVRALRRSGIDITFEDTVKQIRALREEFGIFTTKELIQGTAAFYNLIRDLGFTREEIEKLQRSIVTLAIVNGRSMDDVQKTVALALSSGYTEGLQRLGVSINRVNIAQQAATMGWEKGYMALTEQQRAMATLVLLNQKVAKYGDDVLAYQDSLPGKIDRATKSIEEQKTILGESFLPIKKLGLDIADVFLKIFIVLQRVGNILIMPKTVIDSWQAMYDVLSKYKLAPKWIGELGDAIKNLDNGKNLGDAIIEFLDKLAEKSAVVRAQLEALRAIWDTMIGAAPKLDTTFEGDLPIIDVNTFDELAEAIDQNFGDQLDDIYKAEKDFIEDSAEAWEDWKKDIADITEEYNQDLEDDERKHYQELEDIARKFSQDIADALTEYQSDVIDVWNDYYAALEDAAYDYRQAELQSEKDYQEDLLRLREAFLFDLEDALQARDARAVMNIVRRYNLEKEQAKRSYEDEQEQNRQKYDDTVREAKRQREARLAELYKELAERLAALAIQNAREIEEERINYERELEEERINYERRRAERSREYALQIEELKQNLARQLKEFALALFEQTSLSKQGMEDLRKILETYLGEGGIVDGIWEEYEWLVANHLKDINKMISDSLHAWNKAFGKGNEEEDEEETNDTGGSTQSNTTGSTTSPTKGTTGKAATTNLGNSSTAANTANAITSPTNGKLVVDINLSKGLESEIIDEAMNGMADVLFRSTRQ